MASWKAVWLFLLLMPLVGCAGSRCHITASALEYPVSLSSVVFDANGNVVEPRGDQHLGHFAFSFKSWSIFWTLVPLANRSVDISDDLRREVEARSGEAITNLTFRATNHWYWYFAALIPIIPAYTRIDVEGDVVGFGP